MVHVKRSHSLVPVEKHYGKLLNKPYYERSRSVTTGQAKVQMDVKNKSHLYFTPTSKISP